MYGNKGITQDYGNTGSLRLTHYEVSYTEEMGDITNETYL